MLDIGRPRYFYCSALLRHEQLAHLAVVTTELVHPKAIAPSLLAFLHSVTSSLVDDLSLPEVVDGHVHGNGVMGDESVSPRFASVSGGVVGSVLAPLFGSFLFR